MARPAQPTWRSIWVSTPNVTDVAEVVRVFARHGVEYVLIGGQAAVVSGAPVFTYDFDACYARSDTNLARLVAALKDLDARLRDARLRVGKMSDEEAEDLPFRIDVPTLSSGLNFTFNTRAGAVDVLGLPAGVAGFEQLRANAVEHDIAGEKVLVASIRDLVSMKQASGRPKDLLMLPTLLALQDELERRGHELGTRPG